MSDSPIEPLHIGLDDGYAFTKIALPSGRVFAVSSRARLGAAGVTALKRDHLTVREYDADGLRYSAGSVDGEATGFDDYPVSALNRVVVQHALQVAGLSGRVLHAVLPPNHLVDERVLSLGQWAWVGGWGVGLFLLGLLILRRRPLGED